MKCPKCGAEVPEGKFLCEKCGADIRIVPAVDASDVAVEDEISDNMSRIRAEVAQEIRAEEARKLSEEEKRRRRRNALLFGVLFAVVCSVLAVGGIFYYRHVTSSSYFVGRAYEAANRGSYAEASSYIDRAMAAGSGPTADLLLDKGEYLYRAEDYDGAEETAGRILTMNGVSEAELIKAYGQIIDCRMHRKDYAGIAAILEASDNEAVKEYYREYRIAAPVFSEESGDFESEIALRITADCDGSIFYTLDGTKPDTHSPLYQGPVSLKNGTFTVSAVAVNHYGVMSDVVTGSFHIRSDQPAEPEILTDSGSYTGSAMIEARIPVDGELHYTKDGTDPDADSPVYGKAVKMPEGSSEFRFAVITDDGVSSDVVIRHYTLTKEPDAKLSSADGAGYCLAAMIRAGIVVNTDGLISDGTGVLSYTYAGTRKIGSDSCYLYTEVRTGFDGTAADTGRVFAVNTQTAEVYLYDGAALYPTG